MVSEPIYGLCDMLFTEFVILDQNILAANFNSIDLRHLTQHLSVSIKTFYSSANHFHSEVVRTAEPHLKQVCISNLVPRALFPGLGGGAGKGPGIGRSHDHQTPRICGCTKLAYDRIR